MLLGEDQQTGHREKRIINWKLGYKNYVNLNVMRKKITEHVRSVENTWQQEHK